MVLDGTGNLFRQVAGGRQFGDGRSWCQEVRERTMLDLTIVFGTAIFNGLVERDVLFACVAIVQR